MGSLRNPIGPLPSSIYWRRRAVAVGLLVLLVVLVLWLLTLGGDGGSSGSEDDSTDAKGPSQSTITPGPTPSGPHISERPGGRGDSASGGGAGSGGAQAGSGGAGSGGAGGAGTAGGSAAIGFGGGAGIAVTGDGRAPVARSTLPDCSPGDVRISVRSVKDAYKPDEKPRFELVVKNSGSSACKVDFGSAAALLKITDSKGEEHVWASDDCPRGRGAVLIELPGSGETKRTLEWDRRRSAPQCGTPAPGAAAGPGTYRVEVKVGGVTERTEFALEQG
ncbi:hypothetical protein GCM10010218_51170 [Streptomyces mashuensis]|uniref:DUF4232 domain-containing protein n=1 Tax=Streptomyces mashuensis TaxID=33904 RepID=A0A919B8N5_9ACTN|nr:hypothetical protein [Streptomyces mashuensis]GHF63369.1 hypothetical protein GCM10010218_51170 [Streptomyces mashuensis]